VLLGLAVGRIVVQYVGDGGGGSTDALQGHVVAQGSSFPVSGTRVVCRVGTGSTAAVACGPSDSRGHPLPGTLQGQISRKAVSVFRVQAGRRVPVFVRKQPPSESVQRFPSASRAENTPLAANGGIVVEGTNLACVSARVGTVIGVGCAESRDPLANAPIPGHYMIFLTDEWVYVNRVTSSGEDVAPVFVLPQLAATGVSAS
jgi:hypothetical protein